MAYSQAAIEPQSAAKRHTILGLVAVFTTYFSASYYFRGMGVALPKVAADLNGMALYSWAFSIPGLAGTVVTLVFSKFSDMYGRRIMLMISLGIFL